MKPVTDREIALRFLLGRLTPQEQEAISDRLFTDDVFADTLAEAETDLLDRFARGELSPPDREAVAALLLLAEPQLEKLRLAKALAARMPTRAGRRVPYRALAAIAASLAIVAALWLAKPRPATPPRRPAATAQAGLPAPPLPAKAAPKPVFAALLTPGATRGSAIRSITLPSGASSFEFDLQLDRREPVWSVTLLAHGRGVVWQQSGLAARQESGEEVAAVIISGKVFDPGSYVFKVAPDHSSDQSFSYYYFVIRK